MFHFTINLYLLFIIIYYLLFIIYSCRYTFLTQWLLNCGRLLLQHCSSALLWPFPFLFNICFILISYLQCYFPDYLGLALKPVEEGGGGGALILSPLSIFKWPARCRLFDNNAVIVL